MTLESLINERPGNTARFVRQQLRFNTMDAGGLLQRLDHMSQKLHLDIVSGRTAPAIGDEKIADHSLAAFVNKKTVAEDAPAIDGGISRQDFRIDIPQNHLRGPGSPMKGDSTRLESHRRARGANPRRKN